MCSSDSSEDTTHLHVALKKHYSDSVVKLLLQCGFSADSKDTSGRTPLHVALEYKCSHNVIELLASSMSDINAADYFGNTPLHTAIKGEAPLHTIECLIRNQASVNTTDADENTALHLALGYYQENEENLTDVLVKRMSCLKSQNKFGETVLHIAIKYLLPFKLIELLIAHGADSSIFNSCGANALHYCMLYCRQSSELTALVQLLLKNENLDINAQEASGNTALHMAIQNEFPYSLISTLMEQGADISIQNKMGALALHHVKTRQLLDPLFTGNNLINTQDNRQSTPLHYMVKAKVSTGVLRSAIRYGCSTNIQDHKGKTPLHLAVSDSTQKELFSTVKCLLQSNLSMNFGDKNQDTALHLAVRNHVCRDVAHLLVNSGSDPDLLNKQGRTPLQEFHKVKVLDYYEISLLLQNSRKVNVVDPQTGASFLHRFIDDFCSTSDHSLYPQGGLNFHTFQTFLKSGLDPNINTKKKEKMIFTPLMTLLNSPKRNKDMIGLLNHLLEAGANPNMPLNSENQTAVEVYMKKYFKLERVLSQPVDIEENQRSFFRESVFSFLRAGYCIQMLDPQLGVLLIEEFAKDNHWASLQVLYHYGMSFETVARKAHKPQLIATILSELNFYYDIMTLFELSANVLRVNLRPNCHKGLDHLWYETMDGSKMLPSSLKSKIISCINDIPLNRRYWNGNYQ